MVLGGFVGGFGWFWVVLGGFGSFWVVLGGFGWFRVLVTTESTCLPPMWPGFDFRTRRQMWIEFVGSLLCYERFSPGYSGFPLSPKTNI